MCKQLLLPECVSTALTSYMRTVCVVTVFDKARLMRARVFSCIADCITATRERSIPNEIADIQMKGQSQWRILRVAY